MIKAINDGGPAFAGTQRITRAGYATNEFEPVNGMSLRDYFAAKAMVGLCHFWVQVNAKATINDPDPEIIARMAYEYADAMLKAREVQP